ncbi:MAG TPA: ATP-binding protein [Chitinophagaceae bacterium]|nr:ATP-binding protein [Chitinophagaceae bacterium]
MSTFNLPKRKIWPLGALSIQQKLPLLICILLVCIVIALSVTSYLGVRKTSIEVGKQRLQSLTAQLSGMFGQSSQTIINATRATAHQDSVKKFLLSGGTQFSAEALDALKKLNRDRDSSSVGVELLNAKLDRLLQSGKTGFLPPLKAGDVLEHTPVKPDSCRIGKIYFERDSIFYPVIATITNDKQTIGYVIRWRRLQANQKSVSQLSGLMGTNATIYIGNLDGSLMTNMLKPVKRPLPGGGDETFIQYSTADSGNVIATALPIPNTNWILLVEFSMQKLTETANRFLTWSIGIGLAAIIVGSFIAWIISRKITRPLNQLTAATQSIAGGNYTSLVEANRQDELGELARAFNAMAVQVSNAKHNLEHKVEERTTQLQTANKELEAFSYSVSHDLRAPLRAISGYAIMLKEDYQGKLDMEANRLLNSIVSNTAKMGQLIDDLLAFARMGKKELLPHEIDMKKLAQSCIAELVKNDSRYNVQIEDLPPIPGDQSLLNQVWMNLLSNAIKYSSAANPPQIEVGYREDRSNIVYFIRDNGVGFDMRYVNKLFGIFQRLHGENFEGTGIGLALVKRIIDKHKGNIWAEGAVNRGATFYFSLPKTIQFEME